MRRLDGPPGIGLRIVGVFTRRRRTAAFTRTAVTHTAVAFLTFAAPLAAQPTLDADVTLATRYVFRGQVISSRWNLQPRAWLSSATPVGNLSLGTWGMLERENTRPDEFTLRGTAGSPLAEWDLWTQLTRTLLGHTLTAGVTRYDIVNETLPAISGSPYAEAYFGAERSFDSPITEATWYRLRYWHGFTGARSRYADLSLGNQWLLAPIHDVSVVLTGTAGANLTNTGTRPRRPGAFAQRGITHYELALMLVTVRPCEERAQQRPLMRVLSALTPNQLAYRRQFGRDSVTRFVKPGIERSSFGFAEVTWSPFHCAAAR